MHSQPEHNARIVENLNITTFTNVIDLQLFGFPLNDNLCRHIAENCQSIRTLRLCKFGFLIDSFFMKILQKNLNKFKKCCIHFLASYNLSKRGLRLLMSLPNLTELHINPTTKINLVQEVKQLRRLYYYIGSKSHESHYESLARALPLMPSLTSLTLVGKSSMRQSKASPLLSETVLFQITQTVHSRGQNVVFYSLTSLTSEAIKVREIVCEAPDSDQHFSIFECLDYS